MAPHLDETFNEQVNQQLGIVYKVCGIYFGDGDEKEDVVQEMMYQLWKAYPQFDGRSKFSTWMYSVCLKTALTYRRKQRKSINVALSDRHYQIPEEVSNSKEESTFILLQAVSSLSPLDKAIVLLYLDDLSYEEIAQVTGLSKSNVSVRLVRIKKKLEVLLKKQSISYSDVSTG